MRVISAEKISCVNLVNSRTNVLPSKAETTRAMITSQKPM